MTTALMEKPAPGVTPEQLELVRRTVAQGATADELKLYLYDCARQGVHPLDKLIHFTKRSGKYTPVTSIDFMRIRAAETNEYAGSEDAVFQGATDSNSAPHSASVTVWRLVQGQRCAFTATARWAEYKPESNDFMWRKMPHTMLGKCAEALALRKGFPRQLAGLYAKEEMDQAGRDSVSPDPPDTVIDTATGSEVPAAEKPPAPDGFTYLGNVLKKGAWYYVWTHNQDTLNLDVSLRTKHERVGEMAMRAFQDGLPVRLESKKTPWLDAVYVWKPEANREPLTAAEIF